MPLKRRRNSGQGDGNERENKGNGISNDQSGDVNDEKSSKGGNKAEGQEKPQKIIRQDPVLVGSATGNIKGQDVPRVGAFTRSRVVRKPKREYSPPESPVKKTIPKETKTNTPETKTKRQWELWSLEDKCTFFEALFEAGKDFDFIQNWINQKCKKKGVPPTLIKNKDQVRHFYYRTWHKISKFIDISSDVKKDIQEVYGLINYGTLRKKIKGGLNEKNGAKLNELIYKGYTTVKIRGKNLRIKTPVCNALKKLNCIDNGDGRSDTSAKVPEKIHIEMTPRTNAGWSYVQEMALNPRVRMLLKADRTLSSVMKYLNNKWKPHRLKLKENLSEGSDITKVLTLYPHRDCDVTPISLRSVKEPKIHISLNHYREKFNITSSPTANKMKKSDAKSSKSEPPTPVEVVEPPAFPIDSPRTNKHTKETASGKTDKVVTVSTPSVDVSALMDDDNAVFPDVPLSSGMKESNSHNKESCSQTMELSAEVVVPKTEKVELVSSPSIVTEKGDNTDNLGNTENSQTEISVQEKDLETKKVNDLVELGLSESTAENITLAELYLMFGKDGKLRMEYDWCKDETTLLTSELTNMLRRLVHLATIEFSDFCSKTSSNSVSPCHACGAVRAKNNRAVNNVRGQKAAGRSPLASKFGPVDGMVDACTQTQGSILPPKRIESASQGKDAVFRVPVCSPSFLQRSTHSGTNHQILNHASLFPTQKGIKKIRNNSRKSMIVQRNILPKQMVTIFRPVGQPQPVAIPVSIPSPMSSAGLINVQNSQQLSNVSSLGQTPTTTTVARGGTLVQLNVQSSVEGMVVNPGVDGMVVNQSLLGNISVDVSSHTTSVLTSSLNTNGTDVATTTSVSTVPNSLSPPNISSLLDLSLSNLPAGSAESTDKFIDLALGGNSNSSFSAILDGNSARDSLLNTPNPKNSSALSPPASPSPWLNGEDTGDLTFMNLLSASPMKTETSLSTPVSAQASLFSESSRDSIMGRLPADVDGTFHCMMNENSMDYVVKFADLAAHISDNSDQSLNNLKKTNSSG